MSKLAVGQLRTAANLGAEDEGVSRGPREARARQEAEAGMRLRGGEARAMGTGTVWGADEEEGEMQRRKQKGVMLKGSKSTSRLSIPAPTLLPPAV